LLLLSFVVPSLWFASNAVMSDLVINFGLTETAIGNLTSAVQLVLYFGTLVFAVLAIADRFSPSKYS
jgi:hypothetical protein